MAISGNLSFFQVLFLRHKYIRKAVRLTFKIPTQRTCEKILWRRLQTEPSNVGKINQSTQDSSNFSMPKRNNPAEISQMTGCCRDEFCVVLAHRKLFRNAHYLQPLHNNSRKRKLLFKMSGKMVFAAFELQSKRTYLPVLSFASGFKSFSTSPPQLKLSSELPPGTAKLRIV